MHWVRYSTPFHQPLLLPLSTWTGCFFSLMWYFSMSPSQGPADLNNPLLKYVNPQNTEFKPSFILMWPRSNCSLFGVIPARPRIQTMWYQAKAPLYSMLTGKKADSLLTSASASASAYIPSPFPYRGRTCSGVNRRRRNGYSKPFLCSASLMGTSGHNSQTIPGTHSAWGQGYQT